MILFLVIFTVAVALLFGMAGLRFLAVLFLLGCGLIALLTLMVALS